MLKEGLEILKTRPDNAPDVFFKKYEALLQDTRLLAEIMKWEWNEETYKRMHLLFYLMTKQPREPGYEPNCLPVYTQFFYYLLDWFLSKFEKLPFESWSHLGKEGFDLLKLLFTENKLEAYKKDTRYMEIHGKCEKQLQAILKDEKVLSVLLDFREGWEQYEGLYRLSYLVQKNAEYIEYHPGSEFFKEEDVLPVYIDVQKYIYDWRTFYGQAIVFEDWEDLRGEGLDLLKKLIQENKLSQFQKDLRYRKFVKKFPVRYNKLLKRDYEQIGRVLNTKSYENSKLGGGLQKFINILDQEEELNSSFFEQYGKYILKKVDLLIAVVMNQEWSEIKLDKLLCLSSIILSTIRSTYSGERETSGILPIYRYFQRYMFTRSGCNFFGERRVPFKEWEDLAKEQDDLLKVLIKDHKLDQFRGEPRYIYWLQDRFSDRIDELIKKGYTDLQVMEVPSGL